jgi:plasmid maintenance system antidote protein VapI
MTLSEQLRSFIRQSGLSAYALARVSDVDRAQISRFIRGERALTLPAVDRLCKVLQLELRQSRRTRGG